MIRKDILEGLKQAIERGYSLELAIQSFINAGYNPQDVRDSANSFEGVISNMPETFQEQTKQQAQSQQKQILPQSRQLQPQQKQVQLQKQPQPKFHQALPPINQIHEKPKSKMKIIIILLIILLVMLIAGLFAVILFREKLLELLQKLRY